MGKGALGGAAPVYLSRPPLARPRPRPAAAFPTQSAGWYELPKGPCIMIWADSKDFTMNLRRALFIAAFVLPTAAGPALAQVQPRQAPANPFDQPPQQQGEPPCIKDFAKLRDEVEKHGMAVMAGQKNKVGLPEACKLLTSLAVSQEKMLTYAKKNETSCGIPPQLIQQI